MNKILITVVLLCALEGHLFGQAHNEAWSEICALFDYQCTKFSTSAGKKPPAPANDALFRAETPHRCRISDPDAHPLPWRIHETEPSYP